MFQLNDIFYLARSVYSADEERRQPAQISLQASVTDATLKKYHYLSQIAQVNETLPPTTNKVIKHYNKIILTGYFVKLSDRYYSILRI